MNSRGLSFLLLRDQPLQQQLVLKFLTSTKILLELEAIHRKPSVVLCTDFIDILDRTHHEKYGVQEFVRIVMKGVRHVRKQRKR